MSKKFNVPNSEYFGYGNFYSGSCKTFNYKISPKDEMLKAMIWYGSQCSDKSKAVAQGQFSLNDEGIEQIKVWINEKYQEFIKKA